MRQQDSGTPRKRYRLNKERFGTALILVGIVAALIAIISSALGSKSLGTLALASDDVEAAPLAKDALYGKVIVLDAGHGGFDPGSIGISGAHEDKLALSITNLLKEELISCGAQVIMTREDDGALAETKEEDMAERRRIITESGSDIVVSVHLNWFENQAVSGPVVLFMPGSEQGKKLADAVQKRLNAAADTSGSARSESLYILKSGYQPCIIVECGYLSNVDEEKKLLDAGYQKTLAKAICSGVVDYFSQQTSPE